jgi:hypothetical protein
MKINSEKFFLMRKTLIYTVCSFFSCFSSGFSHYLFMICIFFIFFSSFTFYPSTFPPLISLFKIHSLACFTLLQDDDVIKCPRTICPKNKVCRMLRPMKNVSLGRRVPWTKRSLEDASHVHGVPD